MDFSKIWQEGILGSDLNVAISIVVVLVFGLASTQKNTETILYRSAPSLMTSIGVFGTFLGIVDGLLYFDPENLDSSINQLIDGMKTAFVSSVVGMAGAIIFRSYDAWKHRNVTFADKTGEQVSEAVEKIIDKFNDGLFDKFGENFKLLNDSVIGLNKWLDDHKDEYQKTHDNLDKVFKNVESSVAQQTDFINRLTTQLTTTLNEVRTYTQDTKNLAMDIKNTQDNTYNIIASIAQQTEGLSTTVSNLQESISALTELDFKQFEQDISHTLRAMQQVVNTIETTATNIQQTPQIVKKSIEESSGVLTNHIEETTKNMAKTLEGSIEKIGKQTEQHNKMLDAQIEKALQQLTGKLGALSEAIVLNYKPLVDSLNDVVKLARKNR